ncbi:MAG TPA: lipid droplet-associated protein [Mycobacterium sp.]|uniref:lipid droplet-associated protein n=1 Tax=Mycolicibacterium sp. TaxID=2320850 RepID=UPI0025E5958F|nr:lipid droplet-associated protein [Mycolicibacterium sp.]HPX38021.1 lipid droplet-associated protein [Mycobacterium sp.]HQC77302.1 lipid droplet-associated protein [Mycobacterium sp.]
MATAPYGVRLLVGAAVIAIEETRRLPQTILMYPMTVASTVAGIVMKVQQDLADLVIKGDSALEMIFPPKEEQPDWATFDEDLESEPANDGDRRTEGRFALYSVTDPIEDVAAPAKRARPKKATAKSAAPAAKSGAAPQVVADLDYDSLTLAQLRARMTSLSVPDLRALLAYEEDGKARAPFQTLLANRITRATAK